ncbi:MAG: hypothetical protein EZS28_035876 [Streblomastix strix]|uniref:Uncharacterized protein n=1 Tax=Streblomastix strix TaxID=222440 RepID=A0A5J4UDH0_9EUKA|nr:MAG: hypothetical protein EZS28_035876 [Streblomastix strix]
MKIHNDIQPPNSGLRDQPPQDKRPNEKRNAAIQLDLIPVGKDDEGQYWPGFGPGVPHATDWRKSKQQGKTPSMDDVRAFWRQHNFELRVTCVRQEYDSENVSETLQPPKKQRDRNLEIDSADLEIGHYHSATKDQDMILLTEEVNREKGVTNYYPRLPWRQEQCNNDESYTFTGPQTYIEMLERQEG